MMNSLEDYVGYYESGWFAGLAYIYKPGPESVKIPKEQTI